MMPTFLTTYTILFGIYCYKKYGNISVWHTDQKPAPVHSHSWVSLTYHSKNKIKLSNCSKLMNCLTTKAKFLLKYNRPNTEQAYMHQSSLGQFRRDEWHKSLHQRMNSHGWWPQNSRVGSDNTRPWRWVTAHSSAVNGQRRHCHIDNVT